MLELKTNELLMIVYFDQFCDECFDALNVAGWSVDDQDAEFVDGLDGPACFGACSWRRASEGGVKGGLDERWLDVWSWDDLGA